MTRPTSEGQSQAQGFYQHAAFLVLMDSGALFGCFLDRDLATRKAEAIGGVLIEVPVLSDYRKAVTDSVG